MLMVLLGLAPMRAVMTPVVMESLSISNNARNLGRLIFIGRKSGVVVVLVKIPGHVGT